jgi:inorganic pyrophosphatase
MDVSRGGDGDPLDVLLISESLPTGSLVEAIPIGTLRLSDRGEIDTKIIAVPLDSSLRVFPASNFQELLLDYDPAKRIIEEWFLYYKGYGITELIGWEDEAYAWREIQKWQVE